MNLSNKNGFSLIELSIAVVIIGLLASAVVAGRNLIDSLKIRSSISKTEKIKVALNSFVLQYGELPGDMDNANQYWAGVPVGDGNGVWAAHHETLLAWYHLRLAGLIKYPLEDYPGSLYAGRVGTWAPISPFKENAYGNLSGFLFHGTGVYNESGQSLWLSSENPDSNVQDVGASINPTEAYAIDTKIDDGYPLLGKVISADAAGGGGDGEDHWLKCSALRWYYNNPKTEAPYQLQYNTGDHCIVVFSLD